MNRRALLTSLMLLIPFSLLTASTFILTKENNAVSMTIMLVSPTNISVNVHETFQIDIDAYGVSDVYGWEFKLSWNHSLLEAISITEKGFLRNGADTYLVSKISNTDGYVLAGCTRLRNVIGASGNGTLATIEFQAKKEGTCTLNLYDTKLVNSNKQLMPHTSLDGNVHVLVHDIAVTNITSSKTIVGQGFNTKVNITAENHGEISETFNITIYANTIVIDIITNITLTSGNTTVITFNWNTSTFAKGSYTISAKADKVPGETDTEDNTHIDGIVEILWKGDVNKDNVVDGQDIILIIEAIPSYPGHPKWNPYTDINNDNIIDGQDAVLCIDLIPTVYP